MLSKNPNKKERKKENSKKRVRTLFNTGTRTHKSKKDYDRKREKRNIKKFEKGLDN